MLLAAVLLLARVVLVLQIGLVRVGALGVGYVHIYYNLAQWSPNHHSNIQYHTTG